MATAQLGTLLRHIHKLAGGRGLPQRTDCQLLDDFSARRDEAAFAALVARHGPMVLRVCRRVLNHEQDAEDAFQAVFLVLARQSGSIRKPEALADWLHGVAYRTAMKAKRSAARRRNHEARLRALRPSATVAEVSATSATTGSPSWDDVQAVLDEEIQRLPEPFRAAFVLCVLEGKCGLEVAAELGCKPGTVSSRLTRARQHLRQRLARRGIKLSALLAALAVAESASKAALPAMLANVTVRTGLLVAAGETVAGLIPSHVAALAAGVTRAMFVTKAKIAIASLIAIGLFAAGGGAWTYRALAAKEQESRPSAAGKDEDRAPVRAAPAAVPEGVKVKRPAANAASKTGETFVYKGRVLGPDGKPFAGAKLHLVPPPGIAKAAPVRATTDADGRFEFTAARAEFLPGGAPAYVDVFSYLQVVAVAKDYGPDWTSTEKRPVGELTLRLVKNDVSITGRILDLEGKAVAGAKVRVVRVETTLEEDLAPFLKAWKSQPGGYFALGRLTKILHDASVAGLPKTVTTGADGRFRLPGAGNERIVVLSLEAPRIEHATLRVLPRAAAEVKALVGTASESTMRMGQLAPPTIYGFTFDHLGIPARIIVGTVRDKETGKPMSGVRISGNSRVSSNTVSSPGETRVETHTDKQGRYQLQGLPKAEKYDLFAWPGDFSAYIPGGKEVSGGKGLGTIEADFELIRGVEVRGRVTDKVTGKPVAAGVRYVPLAGNRHPAAAYFRMVAKNCEGPRIGTFREMVPPGPGVFLVTVRAADDLNPYTQVRVDPAEQAKTGLNAFMLYGVNAYRVIDAPADAKSLTHDIQVEPGRTLTGTVLGPDNKPLTGAMVRGLTAIHPKATTLQTAKFTVLALEPRESRELLFVHLKRKLVGKLTVRGDEKGEATVQLKPWATLSGRILDEDGQPVVGVRIHLGFIVDSTFFVPATWWASPQGQDIKTDRDGRFHAEGLTPGMKFRMSAFSDRKPFLPLAGTPDGQLEISVRSGEAKDLGELKVKPD